MTRTACTLTRSAASLGLALGLLLSLASTVSAGGLEWPGLGTRGAGRAGAWRARSDTSLALQVNPANLARLAGTQAEIALHLGTSHLCFDRSGTPTQDGNGGARLPATSDPNDTVFGTQAEYGDVEYPRLCNNRSVFPLPQLALSFRPHRRVGIGVGVVTPNAPTAGASFGSSEGIMPAPDAPNGTLPNASRYDVVRANLLLTWVAAGIGVELHPRLRLGATFGWGLANIQYTTVSAPLAGESPVLDILALLSVKDRFVPRVSGSLAAEPVDGLDLTAGFVWIDAILATGDLRLRSFHFATEETINQLNPRFGSSRTDRTFGAQLLAPQASSLSFAARWAQIRPSAYDTNEAGQRRRREARDPMNDEVFDIELGVDVSLGRVVDAFVIGPHGASDVDNRLDTGVMGVSIIEAPEFELRQNWKTQVGVMLGADYNVVPGRLALRAGVSYENDGIEPGSERTGFTPWSRMSFAVGLTLRVSRLEMSMAYQHMHFFSRTNTEEEGNIRQTTLTGGNVINAGRFTARGDVVSLSMAYRFAPRAR